MPAPARFAETPEAAGVDPGKLAARFARAARRTIALSSLAGACALAR